MKFKIIILICIVLTLFQGCTSTPWHREQADVSLQKGMALLEAGQYIGAINEFEQADKFAPNDPVINYNLGIAYHGRGLKEQAMQKFQKAIALKKDYSEAHNYLGVLYMDMEQWDKAIACFDAALVNYLYATPALAFYNSGWAYYNLEKYDMALDRYNEAIRQDRMLILRPQIEKNIGLIYKKKNNLPQAIIHFKEAVKVNESLYDAHYFLAECYLAIHEKDKAKHSFQEVIRLAPRSGFAQKARDYLQSL